MLSPNDHCFQSKQSIFKHKKKRNGWGLADSSTDKMLTID